MIIFSLKSRPISVPAAAVRQEGLALFFSTWRKACVDGFLLLFEIQNKILCSDLIF